MYPWVEVRSPVFGTTTRGWLLQQQGGTLLLLSRSGVDLVTLGDTPFTVSNAFGANVTVTPEALRDSAAALAQFPRFKEEAGVERSDSAMSSAPPISSPAPGVGKEHSAEAIEAVGTERQAASQSAPSWTSR